MTNKTADLSTSVSQAAELFSSSSSSSSPCVLPDQHHDTASVRAADPEAQPAHPPQLGAAQPGREELLGEQAAGGAGAPGERAAPRCCVRTDRCPAFRAPNQREPAVEINKAMHAVFVTKWFEMKGGKKHSSWEVLNDRLEFLVLIV